MVDYYRTPDTQQSVRRPARSGCQKVTSFADATKLSMETTVLANATGFGVGRRGMYGPSCGYVRELAKLLPAEAMLAGGIVDYSVGAVAAHGRLRRRPRDEPSTSRRNSPTTSSATVRSTSSIRRFICRTSSCHRQSRAPSFIAIRRSLRWPVLHVKSSRSPSATLKAGERLDGSAASAVTA